MAISRRQFFRGFGGPTPEQQRERRIRAVDTYIRTNLLPYDFGLTAEQTDEALSAALAGIDLKTIEDDDPHLPASSSDSRHRRGEGPAVA
jgi:hypothetical protein